MPKPLYIDRKGLRHHGDIQEEYLNKEGFRYKLLGR